MSAAGSLLPAALQRHPRPAQWLRFDEHGGVQVRSGKVEIGQGIRLALAQIVADELGLDIEQVQLVHADTDASPDEGVTSGSLSVQDSGAALRWVCATVRSRCAGLAAQRLERAADAMRFDGGRWHRDDGRSLGYAQLLRDGADAALMQAPVGDEALAAPLPQRWVGRSPPRPEVAALARGSARFIQDLVMPGLLHGRVLHPRRVGDTLLDADEAKARAIAGIVQVFRDGDLIGVLAKTPDAADAALALLRQSASYRAAPAAAGDETQPARTVLDDSGGAESAPTVATTLRARYTKPWIAHASIGPSCALARWLGDSLQVWSHSQGIHNLKRDLALAFGIADAGRVRVQHVPGAGCYGHNAADDVAFDAAWLARRVQGQPVRLAWARADELSRAPMGPAMRVELEADLDAAGRVIAWRHDLWSPGHSSRPGRAATPALLGAWQTATPSPRQAAIDVPLAAGGGSERNAVPGYALPRRRVRCHPLAEGTLRSSALRSLGAYANVFAVESFVDEIARHNGQDALQWRLDHLRDDPRGAAVLRRAAEAGGWGQPRAEHVGVGLGYARYKGKGAWCAVLAEVDASADLAVRRLVIAADVGLGVNPDGVAQQLEGGAIQAVSWALKEAVEVDDGAVSSDSWGRYPILRFSEVPDDVQVHLMPSQAASLGAGEASLGPAAAAIANALCHALGVRVRDLPLTRDRIVAAIEQDN